MKTEMTDTLTICLASSSELWWHAYFPEQMRICCSDVWETKDERLNGSVGLIDLG